MTSADNQQERLGYYIAGYVDGEGSFHIGLQKRNDLSFKYQLVPEFHVSQNCTKVLEIIREILGCGYIKLNHSNNIRDKSSVYVVRKRSDLLNKVIPFFEKYPLISWKANDFNKFAYIVRQMETGVHLSKDGFQKLTQIAFTMNADGKHRKFKLLNIVNNLESSETIRQKPQI